MCIALPLKIVEVVSPSQALCEAGGERQTVDISLIDDLQPGDWVTVHLGLARTRMTEADARLLLDALSALDQVQAGATDVDHLFADLVNREPPRPPTT